MILFLDHLTIEWGISMGELGGWWSSGDGIGKEWVLGCIVLEVGLVDLKDNGDEVDALGLL